MTEEFKAFFKGIFRIHITPPVCPLLCPSPLQVLINVPNSSLHKHAFTAAQIPLELHILCSTVCLKSPGRVVFAWFFSHHLTGRTQISLWLCLCELGISNWCQSPLMTRKISKKSFVPWRNILYCWCRKCIMAVESFKCTGLVRVVCLYKHLQSNLISTAAARHHVQSRNVLQCLILNNNSLLMTTNYTYY